MVIIAIILLIFLLPVVYLFFAPFYVEIDSINDVYRFRFHRLAAVNLIPGLSPAIEVKVIWWRKTIPLMASEEPETRLKRLPEKWTRTEVFSINKLLAVIRSFNIKCCYINVDTGNMQLNGMLYPVAVWFSWYSGKQLLINFTGTIEVVIKIQNSMARMSWAWLSSKNNI